MSRIWPRAFDMPSIGQYLERLAVIGQPSSPGICVSELRFGGVRLIAGEPHVASTWRLLRLIRLQCPDRGFIAASRPGMSSALQIARYCAVQRLAVR